MQRAIAFGMILAVRIVSAQTDPKAEVLKVEAAFSEAKLHDDVAALQNILADDYLGFNQWGARRNKVEVIELFRDFKTTSLVPTHVTVRVMGDLAVIDGVMKESHESDQSKYLFMRTYVKRQGRWLLLTSAQNFLLDENFKVYDPNVLFK